MIIYKKITCTFWAFCSWIRIFPDWSLIFGRFGSGLRKKVQSGSVQKDPDPKHWNQPISTFFYFYKISLGRPPGCRLLIKCFPIQFPKYKMIGNGFPYKFEPLSPFPESCQILAPPPLCKFLLEMHTLWTGSKSDPDSSVYLSLLQPRNLSERIRVRSTDLFLFIFSIS